MIYKDEIIYQKFRNSSLDTSAVGMIVGSEQSLFAATPTGAKVIAWAEGFGIHFCTIEGLGDTIFIVEPDAQKDMAVYPVANNLLELLGLVVACNHASFLWQAREWDRTEFDQQISAKKPGMKQRSVLRAISNIYHPPVIQDPYGYMAKLRT